MSHIFISYAHDDKTQLDKLVAWLHAAGFANHELWYDQTIEGGNNWRDEIASALDEAFVVVVMVTVKSVKSMFCTYEWAYAMGQGIPVLPLIFDEVQITDVLSPLVTKQLTNCIDSIPDSLEKQLRRLKSLPPQIAALNEMIYKTVYKTHRCFFILSWLGDELEHAGNEFDETLLAYFVKEASKAHKILETMMIDKAFVFTGRQYRLCWKLIDFLAIFSRIQLQYNSYLPDYLASQFDTEWLPAFEYFEGNRWWRKWIRANFERDLNDEYVQKQVFAEVARAFPLTDIYEIDIFIQKKNITRNRSKPKED